MMFHHKQAEHVSVGIFKDHEGQPLVTVDGINLGTIDHIEDMIAKFRQQQAVIGVGKEDQGNPSVSKDYIRIQSACVDDLVANKSNIVPRLEFKVESTEAGLSITYAGKHGLAPLTIAIVR